MDPQEPMQNDETIETLVDLLAHRAASAPRARGFRYLVTGDASGPIDALSFHELDVRARRIAAELSAISAVGDRALLLYPDGLAYLAGFFGCLYAGVIAVPAYPPDPSRLARTQARMHGIMADAGTSLVLTTAPMRDALAASPRPPSMGPLRLVATDAPREEPTIPWRRPTLRGDDLAFLQYTSGSTSAPKGVMVTHANLLHTLADMGVGWDHDERSVLVSWLPVFHDLGLIYGLLAPIFGGFDGVLLSPTAFLQRPLRWLEAISAFSGTHSAAPNFAFDLCARKSTPAERARLRLGSWKVVLNAAEPVRAETLARFDETFASAGLSSTTMTPGYGLAEATLKVSTVPRAEVARVFLADAAALAEGRLVAASDPSAARPLVGCGRPALGTRIVIIDPETRRVLEDGAVGEICLQGRGVAAGYWQRPEATEEIFRARIEGVPGVLLRTGDLGALSADQLFVTGRLKDLVIVDGKNHYPQDIELSAERAHPAVRPGCSAAFSIDEGGEERLGLVVEIDLRGQHAPDLPSIAHAIRAAVRAEHQLPLHALLLLRPGDVHKTSSGKIQRRACRSAVLEGRFEPLYEGRHPMADSDKTRTADSIERWLYTEVGKVLGKHPSDLDAKHSLEDHGLKSSQVLTLSGQLETWLGRKLDQSAITEDSTIPDIAKSLAG